MIHANFAKKGPYDYDVCGCADFMIFGEYDMQYNDYMMA